MNWTSLGHFQDFFFHGFETNLQVCIETNFQDNDWNLQVCNGMNLQVYIEMSPQLRCCDDYSSLFLKLLFID